MQQPATVNERKMFVSRWRLEYIAANLVVVEGAKPESKGKKPEKYNQEY